MFTSSARAYRVTGWLIAASPSPGWAPPFCSSTPSTARTTHQALHAASRRDGPCGARPLERAHNSTEDTPMRHVKVHGADLADAMRPLVEDSALDRFQRIRYHRRGVGGSSCPPETLATTVAVHAEDAVGLLEHLGVDRAHVVGHSSGGSIALEIASRH